MRIGLPVADLYRKKPVVIEAMQWDGTAAGATPIINWVLANGGTARYHEALLFNPGGANERVEPAFVAIDTLEGTMKAIALDYVIRGVQEEFYPCKPDIFDTTYDKVVKEIPDMDSSQ